MEFKKAPVVTWWNVDKTNPLQSNTSQVAQPYDFGIVDAGVVPTPDMYYSFLIWNNRGDKNVPAPQMEDVTIGIKDMKGGNGDTKGEEVWSINAETKWFWAKVDSLNQDDKDFSQIGADKTKPIGTVGKTKYPKEDIAEQWSASAELSLGDVIKPTVANGMAYIVVSEGTTHTEEPVWSKDNRVEVKDGTVEYSSIKLEQQPEESNIILGTQNDGTMINGAGNFAKVSLKIQAPLDAKSGRQDFKVRVSFRYV